MSTTIVPAPKRSDERPKGGTVRAPRMFGTDLGSAPLPARGLFYSVVGHGLFLLVTLAVPWSYWMPPDVHLVTSQSQIRANEVLLLPDLEAMGSQSPAAPAHSGGRGDRPKSEAPAPSAKANAARGVVYQGPQVIVSNPPHPDNSVQTILQPDLPAPSKLPAPLNIPAMVSIAPVKPVFAPPAPPQPETPHEPTPVEPVATLPLSLPQQLPKVEAPKLPLPAASAEDSALRAVANAPVPAALPKLAPPPARPPVEANGTQNILVVNALPGTNIKPPAIPAGELKGAFTVSPTGSTSPGPAGGGAASTGAPGTGSATGAGTGTHAGTGTNAVGGSGEGKGSLAGTPAGTGVGTGVGTGLGNGNTAGKGNGAGSGNGNTAGNGSGTGAGHGSGGGAGTGTGTSPFPSIMIQGGSGGSGRASLREPASGKPQSSYGITIVASGASGGGFKDYGIFKEGASYTVYLDMADAGLRASWTMQYALDSRPAPNSPDPPQAHGILEPPFADTKSVPSFPAEVVRRNRGTTILVVGVIDPKGKWETLRIMHSSDPALNQVLLEALMKWTFKPAQLDGAAVSVKCLIGVPVNSLPID